MSDFPGGSDGKTSAHNARDLGSIPGLGRSPWRRDWLPTLVFLPWKIPWTEEPEGLQSMGLKSWTWLSDLTFSLFTFMAQPAILGVNVLSVASPLSLWWCTILPSKPGHPFGVWWIHGSEPKAAHPRERQGPSSSHCPIILWRNLSNEQGLEFPLSLLAQ